jgi:hypothetical protein
VTQKVVLSEEERREKKNRLNRESHARHKERNNAKSRAYYLAHKEQQTQRMAEWRNANKEKIRHLNAKYRKNNKDKCRKNKESWRKNNPDKVRVIQTRYAAGLPCVLLKEQDEGANVPSDTIRRCIQDRPHTCPNRMHVKATQKTH